MRIVTLLIMTALLAGVTSAQEKSESVDTILKELGNYEGTTPAESATPAPAAEPVAEPVPEPAPVAVAEPAPAVEPSPAEAMEGKEAIPVPEPVPAAEEPVDEEVVEALVEESRDYYVGGEFAKAQAGFEQVVQLDPENIWARIYLRKLMERDHRLAEVSGMNEVSAAWDTSLVLRSYAISGDAVEKMGLMDAEGSVDVEVKFPEADFPKGTSAIYQPAMEKIFVRNTRDNLLIIEEILDAMDVTKLSADVEQVEIEAKFVEVSEGTLEELGLMARRGRSRRIYSHRD